MPSGKTIPEFRRLNGSRVLAQTVSDIHEEINRLQISGVGVHQGVDGMHIEPDVPRILAAITGTDGNTPAAYTWVRVSEDGDGTFTQVTGFGGSPSYYPAYEYSGNEDVPVDGSAIVELRPGEGGSYFWFHYSSTASGGGSSFTCTITDGTTSQSIVSNDTITFTDHGTLVTPDNGVSFVVSATDTVTGHLDIFSLTNHYGDIGPYTSVISIPTYGGLGSSYTQRHRRLILDMLPTFSVETPDMFGSPQTMYTPTTLYFSQGTGINVANNTATHPTYSWMSDTTITFNLSFDGLLAPASGIDTADKLYLYDNDTTSITAITISDLYSYITGSLPSSDSTITITDGTTSQDVVSGDTITFTSGTGVDLTVSATDTVTADLDIAGLSTITFNSAEDYVPVLDGTDSSIKRALLPSYSFTLTGDSGSQTISGSDTMTIAGSNGILTAVTAPDTCTVSINIPGLTEETTIEAGDYFLLYDASVAANRKYPASSIPSPSTGGPANASYLSEYTDWSIAATTNTVTLATFSAKTHVDKVLIRRKTAQSGVTEVTFTLTLESTGEASSSYSPIDPLDASDSAHNVALTDYCGSYTNTTALKLTVNSTGGNLSSLTAGAIEVWAFYRTLPVPT